MTRSVQRLLVTAEGIAFAVVAMTGMFSCSRHEDDRTAATGAPNRAVPGRVPVDRPSTGDATPGPAATSRAYWRYKPEHLGKTGAKNIEVSACPKNSPAPPRNLKTKTLAMVEGSTPGMVALAPVVSLSKGKTFCQNHLRMTASSGDSQIPMAVTGNTFVPDALNSKNVSVKASPTASVTIAGLVLQSDVVLSIAEDGTVEADREGVVATGGNSVWVSKKAGSERILFVSGP